MPNWRMYEGALRPRSPRTVEMARGRALALAVGIVVATLCSGCLPTPSFSTSNSSTVNVDKATIQAFAQSLSGQAGNSVAPTSLNPDIFVPENTYFVAATGVDTNNCTEMAPCREVTRALELARHGDLISVGAGTFQAFSIVDRTSLGNKLLVIRGAGNQTRFLPVAVPLAPARGILIDASSAIVLEKFSFSGVGNVNYGVQVYESSDVFVRNASVVGDMTYAIGSFSSQRLHVARCTFGSTGGLISGVRTKDSTILKFSDNIFEGARYGMQSTVSNAADLSAGTAITIERNRFLDQSRTAIYLSGIRNSSIVNNVIAGSATYGIQILPGTIGIATVHPSDIKIYHNTVVAGIAAEAALYIDIGSPLVESLRIFNNILFTENVDSVGVHYQNGADDIELVESDYNFLIAAQINGSAPVPANTLSPDYGIDRSSITSFGSSSLVAQFSDFLNRNFELSFVSAAENKGRLLDVVTNDHLGRSRPYGAAVDIGAYELRRVTTNLSTPQPRQVGGP